MDGLDPPIPLRSCAIEFSTLPLHGGLRFTVLESLLTSLVFLLQQAPSPLVELRRWRASLCAAEAAYVAARGGRPAPPRGLQRRRALTFLARVEALLEGLRSACATSAVHSAVLVLGPTTLNPRLVVHIALPFLSGAARGAAAEAWRVPPVRAQLPPRPAPGAPPLLPEEAADRPPDPAEAAPPLPLLPAGYFAPLPADLCSLATRKVSRALITDCAAQLGLLDAALPALPLHCLVLASPCSPSEGLPPNWLPRPAFSLKPHRLRKGTTTKAGRQRYTLVQVAVTGPADAGGGGGGGSEGGAAGEGQGREEGGGGGEGASTVLGGAMWYQWALPPKGFKGVLPPHPVCRKPPAPGGGGEEGTAMQG